MQITRIYHPRTRKFSHLEINDARIIFRNFAGEKSEYNRAGERNFSLMIDDEDIAAELSEEGWNVKVKPPREEGDLPFMYLQVKVQYNDYGPSIYLKSGRNLIRLEEGEVECLDAVEITSVDLDIRPYDWAVNGKEGRAAYLQGMRVTQRIDRFAAEEEQLRREFRD